MFATTYLQAPVSSNEIRQLRLDAMRTNDADNTVMLLDAVEETIELLEDEVQESESKRVADAYKLENAELALAEDDKAQEIVRLLAVVAFTEKARTAEVQAHAATREELKVARKPLVEALIPVLRSFENAASDITNGKTKAERAAALHAFRKLTSTFEKSSWK